MFKEGLNHRNQNLSLKNKMDIFDYYKLGTLVKNLFQHLYLKVKN